MSADNEAEKMVAAGWELVNESGGKLWELTRGHRYDYIIVDVCVASDRKSLWIKTRSRQ